MFKVNNRNTRTRSEVLAPFWCLYCLLWTFFTPCSRVSIVNLDQVNVSWASMRVKILNYSRCNIFERVKNWITTKIEMCKLSVILWFQRKNDEMQLQNYYKIGKCMVSSTDYFYCYCCCKTICHISVHLNRTQALTYVKQKILYSQQKNVPQRFIKNKRSWDCSFKDKRSPYMGTRLLLLL